jgi:lysozyme family protein
MQDTDKRFQKAVKVVLAHEGGYADVVGDRGGETNFGISKKSYPHLNIKDLTAEQAIAIYYRDYWRLYGYGRLQKTSVATKVFDLAVNIGAQNAHVILQRALKRLGKRLKIDGILGRHTISLANAMDEEMLLAGLRMEATAHYRRLITANPILKKFEQGWMKRAQF